MGIISRFTSWPLISLTLCARYIAVLHIDLAFRIHPDFDSTLADTSQLNLDTTRYILYKFRTLRLKLSVSTTTLVSSR